MIQRLLRGTWGDVGAIGCVLVTLFCLAERPIGGWQSSGGQPMSAPRPPAVACGTLTGLLVEPRAFGVPSGAATIASATLMPAAAAVEETVNNVRRTTVAVPEYCKVLGRIEPVDRAAPPVNFQVNLPTEWNLKAVQLGGGGMNGNIPGSLNTHFNAPETQPAGVGAPISRGFVEMGSDSGHSAATPEWALNDEAAANLAHLQLKKTKDVAVALMRSYYGVGPTRVYFMGSSQGGREALITTQKYPQDYDGVFSQVPIVGFTSITLNPTVLAQKQTGAGWIRPGQRTSIANEVLRQCDAIDGLVDGLVNAYLACNAIFTDLPPDAPSPWGAIRCPGGTDQGDGCLSDEQVATLRAVHSMTRYGYDLAFGAPGFAGWGVGGELRSWLVPVTQPSETFAGGVGATWVKGQIFRNMNQPIMTWDPARYREAHLALSRLSDATDPDLSAFLARGGKLVMKHNTADYTANHRELIRYYEQMVEVMGQAAVDSFARLYIAPGQAHSMQNNPTQRTSQGDVIPSQIDMLQILDDWVEGRATPSDSLLMEQRDLTVPFSVTATAPLCRYPRYPHYNGGDRSRASSYSCAMSAPGSR